MMHTSIATNQSANIETPRVNNCDQLCMSRDGLDLERLLDGRTSYSAAYNFDGRQWRALSEVLAKNTTLTTLRITATVFDRSIWSALIGGLTANTSIQSLTVDIKAQSIEQIYEFARLITLSATLKRVTFGFFDCDIDGVSMIAFVRAFETNKSVVNLTVSGAAFGYEASRAFGAMLQSNTSLRRLIFHFDRFENETRDVSAILRGLATNTASSLEEIQFGLLWAARQPAWDDFLAQNTSLIVPIIQLTAPQHYQRNLITRLERMLNVMCARPTLAAMAGCRELFMRLVRHTCLLLMGRAFGHYMHTSYDESRQMILLRGIERRVQQVRGTRLPCLLQMLGRSRQCM